MTGTSSMGPHRFAAARHGGVRPYYYEASSRNEGILTFASEGISTDKLREGSYCYLTIYSIYTVYEPDCLPRSSLGCAQRHLSQHGSRRAWAQGTENRQLKPRCRRLIL